MLEELTKDVVKSYVEYKNTQKQFKKSESMREQKESKMLVVSIIAGFLVLVATIIIGMMFLPVEVVGNIMMYIMLGLLIGVSGFGFKAIRYSDDFKKKMTQLDKDYAEYISVFKWLDSLDSHSELTLLNGVADKQVVKYDDGTYMWL